MWPWAGRRVRRVKRLRKYATDLYYSSNQVILIFNFSRHDGGFIAVQGKTGQNGETQKGFYSFFMCYLLHTLLAVLLICNFNYFLVPMAVSLRSSSSPASLSLPTMTPTENTLQILSYLDVRAKQ